MPIAPWSPNRHPAVPLTRDAGRPGGGATTQRADAIARRVALLYRRAELIDERRRLLAERRSLLVDLRAQLARRPAARA